MYKTQDTLHIIKGENDCLIPDMLFDLAAFFDIFRFDGKPQVSIIIKKFFTCSLKSKSRWFRKHPIFVAI